MELGWFDPEPEVELVCPRSFTVAFRVEQHTVYVEGKRQHRRSRVRTWSNDRWIGQRSRLFWDHRWHVPIVADGIIDSVDFRTDDGRSLRGRLAP